MLVNPTTNAPYAQLLGDPEAAALLSPERELDAIVTVERALARVQGRLGIIPGSAARRIDTGLDAVTIAPEDLTAATASAGVVVPGLLDLLRARLPEEAAQWLHWGATSQDIVDTAMVLQLAACLDLFQSRLVHAIGLLQAVSQTHVGLVMAGRTRGQPATPITFGLKAARWAQPLIEAEAALPAVRRAALRVQIGGAVGANTASAPHGPAISAALAEELQLADSPPWHTSRGSVIAVSGWLTAVMAGLSKFGADLILMGRSEIGEVRAGTGGGSSTMPHKSNPVAAEALVTLGGWAVHLNAAICAAAAPAEERDGAAWALEWIALPQLLLACGAALRHAGDLSANLAPEAEAMRGTLTAHPEVMAEAARMALARDHTRAEVQDILRAALASPDGFAAALDELAPAVNWSSVLDPASVVPACRAEADRVFAQRGRTDEGP